jgi:hypothetical protein
MVTAQMLFPLSTARISQPLIPQLLALEDNTGYVGAHRALIAASV